MSSNSAIERKDIEDFLNRFLEIDNFSDYGPNGLQIEGSQKIKKIALSVSATKESVEKAVAWQADAMIVHHGLFWKFHGPRPLTGAFAKRVLPLVKNDINLFGYHLPLDANIKKGNAAIIALKLGMKELVPFAERKGAPLGVAGKFDPPIMPKELKSKLENILDHKVIHSSPNNDPITSMGIITGGANSEWTEAQAAGLDSYLTGEISEHDWHEAKEGGIHYFAGGHNATEQFGVQGLKEALEEKWGDDAFEFIFIPSDNPA